MIASSNNHYSFFQILLFLALCFCASVNLFSESLNRLALYAVMPSAFVLSFFRHRSIKTNYYENMLLLLCAWAFISSFWASYPEAASRELHQLVGVVLLTYIFAANTKDLHSVKLWYFVFIVLLINCWVYARSHIIMSGMAMMGDERMHDRTLDANTFSYYTAFCTFIVYMYGEMTENLKKKKWLNWAFILMIPLSFVTALLTASRQILIVQIPFCLILIYLRYFFQQSNTRRTWFILAAILAVVIFAPSAINMYESSYLYERSQIDLAEDSRTKLMIDAYEVGLKYFPLGVGAGNYVEYSYNKHFSHNTYLELWANLGIVGLGIFILILYRFIKSQYKRYKATLDKTFLVFMTFGIIFCLQNVFFSFYTGLWLMGFFILVASHSETYYKTKYLNI